MLLCLYLLASVSLFAQNTDSLERQLRSEINDQYKLDIYVTLSQAMATKDFNRSIEAGNNGLKYAALLKDTLATGRLYNSIGEAHYFKGNYEVAASFFYKAISLLEKAGDKKALGHTFNHLAKLYRKIRELDKSLGYYDRAMDIFTSLNDAEGVQMIWNESGVVFEYRENYTEALNRYNKSLNIARERKDGLGESYALSNIAGVYVLQKKFREAEANMQACLETRLQLKDTFAISMTYSDMGTMYLGMKEYAKALSSINRSNELAIKLQYPQLLSYNYNMLSDLYKEQNNFSEALDYYKKATAIKDSIFNIDKARQAEELNTRYETGKKEKQIAIQELAISRRNYIIAGITIILLLGGFLGISTYRRSRMKQEARMQEAILRQQELASRAILEAEEKERQRIGQDLHDDIGQMMSAAKINLSAFLSDLPTPGEEEQIRAENILSLIDESCKEVRAVSHSMMPNALLKAGLASAVREFINRIDGKVLQVNLYTEGLDERLDTTVETVLYRVIQECVNNVIKHAGAGRLDISIIKDEDGLSATIEDNGRGFDTSDMSLRNGIGLKNIETRIKYLKGEVTIDSSPGHGTATIINISPEHLIRA